MQWKATSRKENEKSVDSSAMMIEEDYREQIESFSWVVSDNNIILHTYQMFLDRIREYIILGDTIHANMFLNELEQFLTRKMPELAEEEEPFGDKDAEKFVYKRYFELHSAGMKLIGNSPRSPFMSLEQEKGIQIPQKSLLLSRDLKSQLITQGLKVTIIIPSLRTHFPQVPLV